MLFSRKIILLLVCLSFAIANSQTKTIKIKKRTTCDFRLIADTSVIDQPQRLLGYSWSGVTKKEANQLRKKLHFLMGMKLYINKDSLFLKSDDVCEIKNKRLVSVRIKTAETPANGTVRFANYVMVHFTYVKKED